MHQKRAHSRPTSLALATTAAVSALLAGCATRSLIDESQAYTDLGQHIRAFRLLDDARDLALLESDPVDPELERAWRHARRNFLLDRARRYIFLEYEKEALVDLAALEAIAPDEPEIPILRRRAVHKLALRAAEDGDRLLKQRLFAEALAAYLEAESIEPTLPEAQAGRLEVESQVSRLTERAQQQFLMAVRKLPEFRFDEVRWHSSNAIVDDPDREDAEALRLRAQRELALEARNRGDESREKGNFGAALVDYRSAKTRNPDLEGLEERIADMEAELQVSRLAGEAQMRMRQGRFDEARELLDEAFAMTVRLRPGISELMLQNRHLEGEAQYTKARDLELQGKKQQALEAFSALAEAWPEGLDDEKQRVELLSSDIASAKTEWDAAVAAEAAGELEQALEHYRSSKLFYARLADADERIAALEAKLAAGKAPAGAAKQPEGN
ncbi:MAG: hypothetical protein KDE27_18390 [Planctomycetes bacterium]|nr:hypothetical protein [Planctomycetota bacterium]